MNKISIITTKGFLKLENVFCVFLNSDYLCLTIMYHSNNEDEKIHIPINEIIEFNIE